MRRRVILSGLLLACAFVLLRCYRFYEYKSTYLIEDVISKKGIPSIIADRVTIKKNARLVVLNVRALPIDPASIKDWRSITNATLVWMQSRDGKFNVNVFYDEMKSDTNFNGGAFYSSRALLFGEVVHLAALNDGGYVSRMNRVRMNALSLELKDFKYKGRRNDARN